MPSDSPNRTDYPRKTEPGEKKKERFCLQMTTAQIGLTTQERQNQVKKKGKVLPSDNNSPNRTDYPRETEPGEKKKGKVLPSDDNSPNRTDYPRGTEPDKKREKFCLQITTAQIVKPNMAATMLNALLFFIFYYVF